VDAVDGGDGRGLVAEDLIPAAERLVGRDGDAAVCAAPDDRFEADAGFGRVVARAGDVVEVEEDWRSRQ